MGRHRGCGRQQVARFPCCYRSPKCAGGVAPVMGNGGRGTGSGRWEMVSERRETVSERRETASEVTSECV